MARGLKDPATDQPAREVAHLAGEPRTEAIRTSPRERLERGEGPDLVAELLVIAQRCAALPTLDDRTDDEILGYDENGLPGRW